MSLFDDLPEICRRNAPIGEMTWFGLGGTAEYLIEPQSISQLAAVLRRCLECNTPVRFLGAGANVLISDRCVQGVVIRLTAEAFTQLSTDGSAITAGAGVDLTKLVLHSVHAGLAGLEVLAGIPGTVGGGVAMNCGGRYGEISHTIETVRLMRPDGELIEKRRAELGFRYRGSDVGKDLVIGATFRLTPTNPEQLHSRFREIMAYKQETQPPLGMRSAGCVFKNPDGLSAGSLIDRTGLKGVRLGSAVVSDRHANFILADRDGNATDVINLIELVRERVERDRGIRLEHEVCIW